MKIKRKKKFVCKKDGLSDVSIGEHFIIKEIAYMESYGIKLSNSFMKNFWINSETLHTYFKKAK